jgi:crotonobetainyl-CoA:carnitine CoA-transferase CaiB-like acyl-CoA transferase
VVAGPEAAGLATAAGRPVCAGLGRDPRFASLEGRLRHGDEIDDEICAWTRGLPGGAVETRLQQAGVPAHVVLGTEAAAGDPQLRARRHFLPVEHRLHGEVLIESSRAELSRTPARVTRAGPTLGGDTDFVLRELLGYSDQQVARLRAGAVLR